MARTLIYEFNPYTQTGRDAPTKGVRALNQEIAGFVEEQMLQSIDLQKSPVQGEGNFKSLTKGYATFKRSQGRGSKADLRLSSDMLNQLKVNPVGGEDKIRISIRGRQGDKAQGHCQIGEAGPPGLPKRRFIPARQQRLTKKIMDGVGRLIDDFESGD